MNKTIELVRQWHHDRNLVNGSTPDKQLLKLTEELGELIQAYLKGKRDELVKEIGDMLVVQILICEQTGLTLDECLSAAYDKIKDRKGQMINGTFVKEDDL